MSFPQPPRSPTGPGFYLLAWKFALWICPSRLISCFQSSGRNRKGPACVFLQSVRSLLRLYLSPFGNVRAAGDPRRFVASTVLITLWLAILRRPLLPTSPWGEEGARGEITARPMQRRRRTRAARLSLTPGGGRVISFRRHGIFCRLSSRVPRTFTRRPSKSFWPDKNEKDG